MLDGKMLEDKDVHRRLPSVDPISARTARPGQATPAAAADTTPLADIAKARAAALKIMETVDFDG
jgi:hypothetical protein